MLSGNSNDGLFDLEASKSDIQGMFALILGLSPTGLYVLRELGRYGIPCGGVSEGLQCGKASRFLNVRPAIEYTGDPQALITRLNDIGATRGQRGLLIPSSDTFIDFIANNRTALATNFDFHDCYTRSSVDLILDKGRFLQKCQEAKVASPGYLEVAASQLPSAVGSLSFPLIIKPALIHQVKDFMAGRKVFIANDRSEFDTLVSKIPTNAETSWLVQEIIAGPESNIVLFSGYRDRQGKVHQAFTARKLRQYPPGFGSASLVRSENLPEVKEAAERLLEVLNFHGIAGIEMKVDSRDGALKIIEMNPRPSLWFAASTAAGRRAPLAAFCDMSGKEMPEDVPQKDGLIWRYALKDMYSAYWYKRRGSDFVLPPPNIGKALDVPSSRKVGAVFAPDDRAPAFRELQNFASKAWRRLAKPKAV